MSFQHCVPAGLRRNLRTFRVRLHHPYEHLDILELVVHKTTEASATARVIVDSSKLISEPIEGRDTMFHARCLLHITKI